MDDTSLRAKSLTDTVNEVQALQAVANDSQVRSVAQLLARCTLALSDGMSELSGIGFTAKKQLVERMDVLGQQLKDLEAAITSASQGATAQTDTLLKWNKALVIATGFYTLFTFILVLVTIFKK